MYPVGSRMRRRGNLSRELGAREWPSQSCRGNFCRRRSSRRRKTTVCVRRKGAGADLAAGARVGGIQRRVVAALRFRHHRVGGHAARVIAAAAAVATVTAVSLAAVAASAPAGDARRLGKAGVW